MIEVIKPGLETSIQELPGRLGFWAQGFPPSGPVDEWSFRLANLLVGNDRDAAALECQFLGPSLRFNADGFIAIAGAPMGAAIDGVPIRMWVTVPVKTGQILTMGAATTGARTYVAFAGGIDTPPVLGSRSTFHMAGVGGIDGFALKAGQTIPLASANGSAGHLRVPEEARPAIGESSAALVECMPGPNDDWLDEAAIDMFFASEWSVQARSNRTGIRLSGPTFTFAEKALNKLPEHGQDASNIVDHGYPLGAVNLAGQTPIILINDGPSAGGFINPFTIPRAAFWKLAHLRPNTVVRFRKVDLAEANAMRRELDRRCRIETLLGDFNPPELADPTPKRGKMPSALATPPPSAFRTQSPKMSLGDIQDVLAKNYGIRGAVTLLTSERDLTAHVVAAHGGREFVFKVANSSEDPAVVDLQNKALDHVASMSCDVPVPEVIRSLDGASQITLHIDGNRHVARTLSYLQGVPVHMTQSTSKQRKALGASLAGLSLALADFTHPAAGHGILWDLKNTAKLEEHTQSISDAAKRKLVEKTMCRFRDHVKVIEPSLRHQVVHNDFNPHNVLVDQSEHDRVSGILDFGDVVDTPVIYDVAVACSYQVTSSGHPLSLATELLSAYHAVNPLLDEEIDILFDLINTRNAMTVTITEWRSKLYPENSAYILRNNPRASLALQQYATISERDARSAFRNACGIQ
ncbi:5-oxoprolinase/urea amidolyase family protein [Mesorhizobium ventifaucium]|uniref:Hydroxylysine kinase n=1 Tax=Mesorhizobium ventifaucium TaxID=666020 RepID=A0ABN8JG79_9HYPH|nr:5-oxoprolinase/urea amidolyase family protein [Mesorhizobium ventifaucium]CAH2396520.1 putative Hydroxylysine kinase [Mesorhizobium ventifaucium]